MQSRPASEPGGEEEAAEGHGQVPLGPRHQREDPGGGVQRGLRGAQEITPHVASGQETLQDRDTQTRYLLYFISQSRPGRVKVPPPLPMRQKWMGYWTPGARCASTGFGKVRSSD